MSTEFYWVAVAIVSITSAARLSRLLTVDKFPPVIWLREKWVGLVVRTDIDPEYTRLAFCGYCMSFWTTLAVVLSGWLSDFHTAWWVVNSVFGAAYLAAIVQANDGDQGEDDD